MAGRGINPGFDRITETSIDATGVVGWLLVAVWTEWAGDTGAEFGKVTITLFLASELGAVKFGKSFNWLIVGNGKIGYEYTGDS